MDTHIPRSRSHRGSTRLHRCRRNSRGNRQDSLLHLPRTPCDLIDRESCSRKTSHSLTGIIHPDAPTQPLPRKRFSDEVIARFDEAGEAFEKQLDKAGDASDDAWDSTKDGVKDAWNNLIDAFDEMKAEAESA